MSKARIGPFYKSTGPAAEYSDGAWSFNPTVDRNNGAFCSFGCGYCYVNRQMRLPPNVFKSPSIEAFTKKMTDGMRYLVKLPKGSHIFMSFLGDIFQMSRENKDARLWYSLVYTFIGSAHLHDIGVTILTKKPSMAEYFYDKNNEWEIKPSLDEMWTSFTGLPCKDRKDSDLLDGPLTDRPVVRFLTMETYHNRGITTGLSIEPVLCLECVKDTIESYYGIFDKIFIGALSGHTDKIDWKSEAPKLADFIEEVDPDKKIKLKNSIRKYLW